MATQIVNQFTQFELTESEQTAGELLSVTQVQVIRNLLAAESIKRLGMTYDPNSPMQFMQQEAEIQGAIGAYTYLLEASEVAHKIIMASAVEEVELEIQVQSINPQYQEPVMKRIFDQ